MAAAAPWAKRAKKPREVLAIPQLSLLDDFVSDGLKKTQTGGGERGELWLFSHSRQRAGSLRIYIALYSVLRTPLSSVHSSDSTEYLHCCHP